jgi:hypothetical protein
MILLQGCLKHGWYMVEKLKPSHSADAENIILPVTKSELSIMIDKL